MVRYNLLIPFLAPARKIFVMIRKKQEIVASPEILEPQGDLHAQIAAQIYRARTEAGLSQKELAERVGTRQAQIARLEDANYRGHSLDMLQRIAACLDKQLSVRLSDIKSSEAEEAEAARRLKAKTPPNSELLTLVGRAEVPPEIEDIQEERPW